MFTSINPYTQEHNAEFETISNHKLETIIQQAHTAYQSRSTTILSDRIPLFHAIAGLMDERRDELAKLETIEMGRLYETAKLGITSTANLIRWFANNAQEILAVTPINNEWLVWHIQYDALGIIYGIAPWNFPFNQLLRAAIPNILAGNTQIYKHASNVPLCAQAIQQLFDDAGFPKWVYTNLWISSSQSEYIIAHDHIAGVNLTGWEKAGSAIGSLAGKYLKPSVLELWGNDAFIVLDHADTDAMAAAATTCRISNAWQRCNGSKRFVVLEKYYDEFCSLMSKHMSELVVWDPMDSATQLWPIARPDLIQEIHQQVQDTIAQWARCLTWWEIVDTERNLYAATVLVDVTSEMTSYRQEVFGPVASIIKAKDIEDAIHIANHNDLWLSAVVYGDDIQQCKTVATQLVWGMIFINQPAWSKASLPFWWVKKSWYGKENWPDGLKSFANKKVVLY